MNKINLAAVKAVKMKLADIEPSLAILKENRLENWSYGDFEAEIQRENSLVLVAKVNSEIAGFCIARLITTFVADRRIFGNNHSFGDNLRIPGLQTEAETGNLEFDCEIYNIAVKKKLQNKGIGQALLDGLISLAGGYNTKAIWLEVRSSNDRAVGFYRKNGFGKIYERKSFYSNPSESAFVMKRDL